MADGTVPMMNTSTTALDVRFDGKHAYTLKPGLNRGVPQYIADFAKQQHPKHVRRATTEEHVHPKSAEGRRLIAKGAMKEE